MIKKIVLAYSGGLDTSVMVKWLTEEYKCDVIACYVWIGQEENIKEIKERALKSGATKFCFIDALDEFLNDFVFPALKCGATYEGRYYLATALARPLISKKIIETAKKENADAVAHGATGKGNDQVRFELSFKALSPDITIIAPWRIWSLKSRQDEINYAKKHHIPIPIEKVKYSIDSNIWHTSYEGYDLEDIEKPYKKLKFAPYKRNKPTYIKISFRKGTPVGMNNVELTPVELIRKLNKIGKENMIGIVDMVENRITGMKSRGIYECPAATLLYHAHRELESITLDRDTLHFKQLISSKYGELVYYGLWFSPLREALDAFINQTQEYVTGDIKLKIDNGSIFIMERKSPYSLYLEKLVTFEQGELFDQKDSTGFINIFGLPLKILSKVRKNYKSPNQENNRIKK